VIAAGAGVVDLVARDGRRSRRVLKASLPAGDGGGAAVDFDLRRILWAASSPVAMSACCSVRYVTVSDGQRLTVTLTATFQTASGTIPARFNVCYQSGGGAVTEFTPVGYLFVKVTTNLSPYTVSGTRTFRAGTYTIGYCAVNTGGDAFGGDWLQGWLLQT
jgi:hypothetical protein